MRKLSFDYASIEPEIKAETDELIVVPAVIARETRAALRETDGLQASRRTGEGQLDR